MIDITTEKLIRLGQVPDYLPNRMSGKKPHIACGYRWVQKGIKGIKLEVLLAGGTMVTSVEALQRFFERCTAAEHRSKMPERTSRQRSRAIEKAERELSEKGL
jgi:hypothetical protein